MEKESSFSRQFAAKAIRAQKAKRKERIIEARKHDVFFAKGKYGMVVYAWLNGDLEFGWDSKECPLDTTGHDLTRIANLLIYGNKLDEPINDYMGWNRARFEQYLNCE